MSLPTFQGLQPWLIPYAQALYRAADVAGMKPRVTSVRRSRQTQAILYERYKKGLSQFPAAPPGRSLHEIGLAFDMVTTNPAAVGKAWNDIGGRWFPGDWVHFEVRR